MNYELRKVFLLRRKNQNLYKKAVIEYIVNKHSITALTMFYKFIEIPTIGGISSSTHNSSLIIHNFSYSCSLPISERTNPLFLSRAQLIPQSFWNMRRFLSLKSFTFLVSEVRFSESRLTSSFSIHLTYL